MRPRRPKNTKTRLDAVKAGYRSGFEKAIADDLTSKGIKFAYEGRTISYKRPVRGGSCNTCGGKEVRKSARYIPDFELGNGVIIEAKGRFTSADRTKMLAVRESVGVEVRLLFAADNWTTKRHKQRYSDWCTKHGFVYAIGRSVPASWPAVRATALQGHDGASQPSA